MLLCRHFPLWSHLNAADDTVVSFVLLLSLRRFISIKFVLWCVNFSEQVTLMLLIINLQKM